MKEVIKKLSEAKKQIASQKIEKVGKNTFSNYNYFTPEQVCSIVEKACEQYGLFTKFDLIRDELGIEGQLSVYDIESGDSITFICATEIPEIKGTNGAMQIGGCMTFTERYLKMTAFGIAENSLDFDTTENSEKRAKENKESEEKKRFNKEELEALKKNQDFVKKFDHSAKLIEYIEKKYKVSKEMKMHIADVRAETK